jgi:DEAD/DEAH box helicase domain-containing protein
VSAGRQLARLLAHWRTQPAVADNIAARRLRPAQPPELRPLPPDLPPALTDALAAAGITALYSHQAAAWDAIRGGDHVALTSGTASGKTLAFALPIAAHLTRVPTARALLLYPTKALAHDQLAAFRRLFPDLPAAVYDGDTPASRRPAVRQHTRLLLTNPDMLHLGILPHHTRWADFLEGLAYVVIDEQHVYRGVFGSQVANVLRRLRRIAAHYGTAPQFLLTSATIANPEELAEGLVEAPVTVIAGDGAGWGAKTFLLYNPPVIEPALGLRRSPLTEATFLGGELAEAGVQTIVFGRTRRTVEQLLLGLRARAPGEAVRAYRSGYLPAHRREIEAGLRSGEVRLVAATNALELGIDLGNLEAALLVGYPGSMAAVWQQSGRAGRGQADSLALLIASADPLDQFLVHHPDYFFERPVERALIDPDNPLILLDHLRCAAFELPFRAGDGFGRLPPERLSAFLEYLREEGVLHASAGQYFWMADAYPAQAVGLRSASALRVRLLVAGEGGTVTLGEVEGEAAPWMVHPEAIYLHEGQAFRVLSLDLERGEAVLTPFAGDYTTAPVRQTTLERLEVRAESDVPGGGRWLGEVRVTAQVVGYRQYHWPGGELLGEAPLDLPPTTLVTTGYGITLGAAAVDRLRQEGLWRGDPNDYGPGWAAARRAVRARDGYRCAVCGAPEGERQHEVHHRTPFRLFASPAEANRIENLITLCPACHRRVEANVRVRSGLAGLGYVLAALAPLWVLCDPRDLGLHLEPQAVWADGRPAVVLFDMAAAGVGLSAGLYARHAELLAAARAAVAECPCADGCPSCVGPGGENGAGGKAETLALLELLAPADAWIFSEEA